MDRVAIRSYFVKNWYKLALALLLLFIILKKDLSLHLRLHAPAGEPTEQSPLAPEPTRPRQPAQERMSDNAPILSEREPPQVELFDFSSIDREAAAAPLLEGVSEGVKRSFRQRFAHVAVAERKKFGIPASLVMGHTFLLSEAGRSDLARKSNNFFALPCTEDWRGARRKKGGACYRRYDKAWTSFRDHSLFLISGAFAQLRRLEADDYRGWARALEKAGFYPKRGMGRQVIEFIESEQLYELDR